MQMVGCAFAFQRRGILFPQHFLMMHLHLLRLLHLLRQSNLLVAWI
jgi:hypothetical protein